MLTKYRAKLIVIAIVGGILLTVCHRGYVEFISLGLMDDQSGIEVLATDSKETKVAKWRLKQRMNGIKAPKGTSDKEAKVIKYAPKRKKMKDKAKYESMQNLTLAKQLESRMKKHNFIKYFDQLPAKLHDERIKWLNGEQIYTINYVGNAIPFNHNGPGKFLPNNPLYDPEIDQQFDELMESAQNQKLYQELLKERKNYYMRRRHEKIQEEMAERNKENRLAYQLPHIIVSGFKKCGTKTVQHFFGFHPEIISGRSENPVTVSGDAKIDVDAYLYQTYQNWDWNSDENREKLSKIRRADLKPYFMTKTANKGLLTIKQYIDENPDFITIPYIYHWWDRFYSISVVCDPIQRLLSDFKHVTRDWSSNHNGLNSINRIGLPNFLGPDSVIFPFKNMTFDQMVDKFLPYLNNSTAEAARKADPNVKNYMKVFEMFRAGRFKTLQRDYIGDDGKGLFANPGIVINGARMKTEPWKVFQELEQKIGLTPFFTEDHFGRREDGFYCVKPEPVTNATRLECMPSSKGGKEFAEQQFRYTISELTRTKLNGFYREAIDSLFKNFQIKF